MAMVLRRVLKLSLWNAGLFLLHLALAGLLATALVCLAPELNVFQAYFQYLSGAARGDLGVSSSLGQPVSQLLQERIPTTAVHVGTGLGLAWLAAFGLGSFSSIACGRGRLLAAAGGGALLSVPSALIAFGTVLLGAPAAVGIAAVLFPRIHRYVDNLFRSGELKSHVLAARAQGISNCRIFSKHVLRNVLVQLIALGKVSVNMAMSAAIPIEVLCDQAGVGQLAWRAALSRDVHLVVTIALAMTFFTILANRMAGMAMDTLRVRS